jgi:hypothetical protein
MWHFYLATPAKPHYAALRKILNAPADNLAAIASRILPHSPPALLRRPDRAPGFGGAALAGHQTS